MIFSKRSRRLAVALATAVGLFQNTTAEDGFQTNLLRGNSITFGETIPLELQGQGVANETNVSAVFDPQQLTTSQVQTNGLQIAATDSTCVTTSIAVVMDYRSSTSKEVLACGTANGNHYKVAGVPDEVIQANKHHIMNGDIELAVPAGSLLNAATATLEMPIQVMNTMNTMQFFKEKQGSGDNNSTKTLFDRTRRSLAMTGTRSALVVRIVASNAAASLSVATLSNSVFGNGADGTVDPVTMKSHFNTCSYGQLNFIQAADRNGKTARIRNGAVTVTVPYAATWDDWGGLANAVNDELRSQFGVTNPNQLANHLMYFLPPNVIPTALGYAPGDLTLYNDKWNSASVLMHEVGHNLGMGHSGEEGGGGEYGDETCIMGGGFSENGVLQCYNAAKSWQMGWFASRHHTYNIADGVWSGRLIGQVDYAGNDKTSKVILKLNTPGSDDYFVMFNRVKTGTIESKDLVMITMAGGEGITPSQSNVVAKLGSGESTILPNFYLWESLEVTVNKIELNANPAYAAVTVKMGCLYNCGASLETWTGIGGGTIADLISGTNNFANPPQKSERLQSVLEGPSNWNDNYGSRMRGWLVAPVTGDYKFWIASDDNGEFWLSTDDDPANMSLACHQPYSASPRQWDRYAEQKSGTITLVAGQAYYYEALMKEGGGGDNFAIAWQYPGKARDVISAEFSRVVNPFQVVGANLDTWTGIGGVSIADLRSGTNNLANAPQTSDRLQGALEARTNVNDNYGSRMRGWLVPPVTADYQFFIASDDNGEFWLSTDGDPDNKVLICRQPFAASPRWWNRYPEQTSELISLEAGQSYYYEALMKEGGGGDNLAVAWKYPGQPTDVIPARFSRSELTWMKWDVPSFGAKLDSWTGIGGETIADLMSGTNNLTNPPQKSEFLFNLLEAPSNWDDNFGSRLSGWLVPPVTGDYEFWIASDNNGELWLSTDDDPANRSLACHQPFWASSRQWDKYAEQKSGTIALVAGQAYYYEALMKEGNVLDNLAIAWQYPGQSRVVIPAKYSRLTAKIEDIQPPAPQPTSEPTPSPTPRPSQRPTSRKPTLKPTSRKPTLKPTSKKPTVKLVSKSPTRKPI